VQPHVMQRTVLLSQFCPYVHLSDACIVTKRNNLCRYLNTIRNKDISKFPLQQGLLGIVPLHPKYSPKVTHPLRKTLTLTDFRLNH